MRNHLQTRRHHPTYGMTKTGLRKDLDIAEGMLRLLGVVTGQTGHAHVAPAQDPGFDQLKALRAEVAAL